VSAKVGYGGDAMAVEQFFMDQDTGGAIRTAGRADLYLGAGDEAERVAGSTRVEGQLYYFFLKE
jgi:membrane-bound lytic murein transglycosylase A